MAKYVNQTFTQTELDVARKTMFSTEKLYFIENYMSGTLQSLRDSIDEKIKEYGADAEYDLDIGIGYGYYDDRYVEIEQTVKFERPETDKEVTKRLNKIARDKHNAKASQDKRAADRKAARDAKKAEAANLAATLGIEVPKRTRKKKAA